MVHESEEALNIIEDMMEEQIISTEEVYETRGLLTDTWCSPGQS